MVRLLALGLGVLLACPVALGQAAPAPKKSDEDEARRVAGAVITTTSTSADKAVDLPPPVAEPEEVVEPKLRDWKLECPPADVD
ncbi:MAG: hypothetical protein QF464_22775, partial [Myxococcota bacterium]|nr:hypothetical protein [Myxococcota bacterium]